MFYSYFYQTLFLSVMAGMRFFKTYLELVLDTCLEKLAKITSKPVPDDVLERKVILREEKLTTQDIEDIRHLSGTFDFVPNPMEQKKNNSSNSSSKRRNRSKKNASRDVEMTNLDQVTVPRQEWETQRQEVETLKRKIAAMEEILERLTSSSKTPLKTKKAGNRKSDNISQPAVAVTIDVGHQKRRATHMPEDWIRHVDGDSGTAYYQSPDGTVTWDKPPGLDGEVQ